MRAIVAFSSISSDEAKVLGLDGEQQLVAEYVT